MKTPEGMERLEELFHEAVKLGPQERAEFIALIRSSNPELLAQLESLISAHEKSGAFIDSPAYEVAAESIVAEQPALAAGQTVAHYQIVKRLGKGGMGEVYLATDSKLDRKVALKILPPEFTGHKERLRRFIQEAKATSALNHPNIITIHEIGTVNESQFIATEFINGETLRHRLARARPELPELVDIAIQTSSALVAAHDAGVVHRDIKPENIMLRPDGVVKVLDFGLAKLTEKTELTQPTAGDSEVVTKALDHTRPGAVLGTVNYMSPEQARGQELDQRSDIFSFGVVMYEMATGKRPFAAATSIDTLVSILKEEPRPLDSFDEKLPAEFQRIINKALRKDRDARYQSAKDLLIDLKSFRDDTSFEEKLARSRPPQSKSVRTVSAASSTSATPRAKTNVLIKIAFFVLFAAIAAPGFLVWNRQRQTQTPTPPPNPQPQVERTMTYWITVQKYRDGKPFQDPFRLSDEINFEKDYQIRVTFSSPQSGWLYLLNEGPVSSDRTPTYNVLFPSATTNKLSAALAERQQVQIPEKSWLVFDDQQGTEIIWLVWSEKNVPELEAVKNFANEKDRGVIGSPGLRASIAEYLRTHVSQSPSIQRQQDTKETVVKVSGELLVHAIRLEHH